MQLLHFFPLHSNFLLKMHIKKKKQRTNRRKLECSMIFAKQLHCTVRLTYTTHYCTYTTLTWLTKLVLLATLSLYWTVLTAVTTVLSTNGFLFAYADRVGLTYSGQRASFRPRGYFLLLKGCLLDRKCASHCRRSLVSVLPYSTSSSHLSIDCPALRPFLSYFSTTRCEALGASQ